MEEPSSSKPFDEVNNETDPVKYAKRLSEDCGPENYKISARRASELKNAAIFGFSMSESAVAALYTAGIMLPSFLKRQWMLIFWVIARMIPPITDFGMDYFNSGMIKIFLASRLNKQRSVSIGFLHESWTMSHPA